MATSSKEMKQTLEGFTFRKYKDGDHAHRPWSQQIFEGDHSHKCPTYLHQTPPCQGSCPAGEDIRGYLNIEVRVLSVTFCTAKALHALLR